MNKVSRYIKEIGYSPCGVRDEGVFGWLFVSLAPIAVEILFVSFLKRDKKIGTDSGRMSEKEDKRAAPDYEIVSCLAMINKKIPEAGDFLYSAFSVK